MFDARALYTDTVSNVRVEGILSNWFEIRSGVGQGCKIVYHHALFLPPMDWVLERTAHKGSLVVTIGDWPNIALKIHDGPKMRT